ncbi:MAG: tetratricopeptide repeat-containing sensor histidine kinase [Cyclobacteriaceae bacterium]
MSLQLRIRAIHFVIAFLLCFSHLSHAQNQRRADSLKSVLDHQDLPDSTQLLILYTITYSSSSPDDILQYANRLLDLAQKKSNTYYISQANHHLGLAHRFKGDLKTALDYLFKSANEAQKSGTLRFLKLLGLVYGEIANCYTLNNDAKNALLYNVKAIQVFRKAGNNRQLAINLLNTGYNLYLIDDLDSAISFYNEAEPIFAEIDLEIGKAYTVGNRALVYWKKGDYTKAEQGLFDAIDMLKPLGDQYGIADYYNQLGNIYLEQGQRKKAIEYTEKGLNIAIEIDLKEQIRDASKILFELYKDEGDLAKAVNYQTQYIAFKDSIQDQETTQRIADLRTEFEVGQKQVEVDLLSVQKRNQQLVSIGLSGILLLSGIFLIIIFRNYREKNRINKLLEAQANVLNTQKTELEQLNTTKDKFFSIISHDLRGPVSSFFGISAMIKMYVASEQTEDLIELAGDIDESVDRLSSLLDNLLNWAMQQQGQIPFNPRDLDVSDVVANIKNTLQNMADGKQIELITNVTPDVKVYADRNTTETILRNLTSNALKFTPENGKVELSAVPRGNEVLMAVSDTGVGIPKDKMATLFTLEEKKSTFGTKGEKGLGVGLQLVEEFTKLNGGHFDVVSEEGVGTTFSFTLPLYFEPSE